MKQTIEIEVPEGKKAIWKDNKVTFVDVNSWEDIKTFKEALNFVKQQTEDAAIEVMTDYNRALEDSYQEVIAKWRIIMYAITRNEELYLDKGGIYVPIVQFAKKECEKNCWGKEILGHIKTKEGKEYSVVGGHAHHGSGAGLGYLTSIDGVSGAWTAVGFRSVSSSVKAKHLSKYFGRYLFEVLYRGCNCDWEWID